RRADLSLPAVARPTAAGSEQERRRQWAPAFAAWAPTAAVTAPGRRETSPTVPVSRLATRRGPDRGRVSRPLKPWPAAAASALAGLRPLLLAIEAPSPSRHRPCGARSRAA